MQIVIELLQGTVCCSFSAGVDASVVLKVVLAVSESKEKRKGVRSFACVM
jgi:predicted phosphoadenosine phosphosulfate sulfurtransferase